ncbi:hypothetical protein [Collimonas humicola]|uniref:hypothetical protein n=1 Tax=Collimonas humicola TaxID=2825886 RepID=UPI001B8A9737
MDLEYVSKKKLIRRDHFFAEIDAVKMWAALRKELRRFSRKQKTLTCRRLG